MYVVAAPLAVVVGEIVPQGAVGQDTDQATPLAAESFVTVAVNCAVEPGCIVALSGKTETVTMGTVIVVELFWVASAAEVAVRVTVKSLAGGVGGAV